MNVVERAAARPPATVAAPPEGLAAPPAAPPPRKAKLKPLMLLGPYVWRYRGRAFAAVGALIVADIGIPDSAIAQTAPSA